MESTELHDKAPSFPLMQLHWNLNAPLSYSFPAHPLRSGVPSAPSQKIKGWLTFPPSWLSPHCHLLSVWQSNSRDLLRCQMNVLGVVCLSGTFQCLHVFAFRLSIWAPKWQVTDPPRSHFSWPYFSIPMLTATRALLLQFLTAKWC